MKPTIHKLLLLNQNSNNHKFFPFSKWWTARRNENPEIFSRPETNILLGRSKSILKSQEMIPWAWPLELYTITITINQQNNRLGFGGKDGEEMVLEWEYPGSKSVKKRPCGSSKLFFRNRSSRFFLKNYCN